MRPSAFVASVSLPFRFFLTVSVPLSEAVVSHECGMMIIERACRFRGTL